MEEVKMGTGYRRTQEARGRSHQGIKVRHDPTSHRCSSNSHNGEHQVTNSVKICRSPVLPMGAQVICLFIHFWWPSILHTSHWCTILKQMTPPPTGASRPIPQYCCIPKKQWPTCGPTTEENSTIPVLHRDTQVTYKFHQYHLACFCLHRSLMS